MTVTCTECDKNVRTSLPKHYRNHHPILYVWATRMNIAARQTRRFWQISTEWMDKY